jgi:hypothetical protein
MIMNTIELKQTLNHLSEEEKIEAISYLSNSFSQFCAKSVSKWTLIPFRNGQ